MSCPYTFGDTKTDSYGETRAALKAEMNQVAVAAHDGARGGQNGLDDNRGFPSDVPTTRNRP
jgi:hypothetical protein